MSLLELRQKLYHQIDQIPEEQLGALSTLMQQFRTSSNPNEPSPRTPGLLSGTVSNSFLDPLEEELQAWE
jgi:hypothetical protein